MIAMVYNNSTLSGDLVSTGGLIQADRGLATAVSISLFTWRGSPESWWGSDDAATFGSEIWRLHGRKQSQDTLSASVGYVKDALRWLITDGIASDVQVSAGWVPTEDGRNVLWWEVGIIRPGETAVEYVGVWEHQTS